MASKKRAAGTVPAPLARLQAWSDGFDRALLGTLAEIQTLAVEAAIDREGSIAGAARALGVSRSWVYKVRASSSEQLRSAGEVSL